MFQGNAMATPSSLGKWPHKEGLTDEDTHIRNCIPVRLFEGGKTCCPDCYVEDNWHEGPSGGFSINIICGRCHSQFNFMFPFGINRIGQPNPNNVIPLPRPRFLSKSALMWNRITSAISNTLRWIVLHRSGVLWAFMYLLAIYVGWNLSDWMA